MCAFLLHRMQMPLMMPLQLHHREALSSRPQFCTVVAWSRRGGVSRRGRGG